MTVSGGSTASGIDILTNIDNSGPTVVLPTSPVHGSTGDRIDTAILIRFSESIDISTIQDNFRVREKNLNTFMTGAVSIMRDDSLISFTPSPPYLFAETYVCSLKTGLKEVNVTSYTQLSLSESGNSIYVLDPANGNILKFDLTAIYSSALPFTTSGLTGWNLTGLTVACKAPKKIVFAAEGLAHFSHTRLHLYLAKIITPAHKR